MKNTHVYCEVGDVDAFTIPREFHFLTLMFITPFQTHGRHKVRAREKKIDSTICSCQKFISKTSVFFLHLKLPSHRCTIQADLRFEYYDGSGQFNHLCFLHTYLT